MSHLKKEIFSDLYSNLTFVNAVTKYLGNIVKLHTITGAIFEGVFRTYSPHFDVALGLAHKVDPSRSDIISIEQVAESMIFSCKHILLIEIVDAEADPIANDVFTNNESPIQTKTYSHSTEGEKVLEPWDGGDENYVELSLIGNVRWDPNDMFKKNEILYGVTSDFDNGLSAYTTPLKLETNIVESMKCVKLKDSESVEPKIISPQVEKAPVASSKKSNRKKKRADKSSRKFRDGPRDSLLSEENLVPSKSCMKDSITLSKDGNDSTTVESSSSNNTVRHVGGPRVSSTCSLLNPLAKEFIPLYVPAPIVHFERPCSVNSPSAMSIRPLLTPRIVNAPVSVSFLPPMPSPIMIHPSSLAGWPTLFPNVPYAPRQ